MSEQAADRTAGDESDSTHGGEGGGDTDQLLDKLGFEDTDPNGKLVTGDQADPVAIIDSTATKQPPSSNRMWAAIAGVLALGLVIAIGAVIWLATSDDSSEIATDDQADVEAEVGTARGAAPEIGAEADKLRSDLAELGLDNVEVAVRASIIYIEGSVANVDEVAAVYEAAGAVADGILVDTSGLVADGSYEQAAGTPPQPGQAPPPGQGPPPGGPPPPGAPPPFGPPPNEPRIELQGELDRVLSTTPIVFESGQTDLSEAQRAVLDSTVTSLLYTYPGIPLRVVGYTDDAGDDDANIALSIKRAEAVRQHLILQGVPGFGLIAEGRGEIDASGDAAVDRRVELEVVLLEEQSDDG